MYSIWVYKYRPTLVKRLFVLFNIDKSCVETKIDPHAHVERDKDACMVCNANPNFNSHAHVERDPFPQLPQCPSFHFNSHAHVERDLVSDYLFYEKQEFQLTRSRGA